MASDPSSTFKFSVPFDREGTLQPYLSTSGVGTRQRRLALGVLLASAAFFLAAAPFAKLPLPAIPAFLPAYQSALVINDLITAVLLCGQFAILRSRALLVLASAYVFSAAMAVSHALSFPGLFSPGGLFGAGPQTTAWLYFLWHGGFPLLVVAYAVLKDRQSPAPEAPTRGPGAAILAAVAAALAVACMLTLLATAGHDALPVIMQGDRDASTKVIVASVCWALSLAALPVLWRHKPHSLVDLWLMVTVCVWIFDIALAAVLNGGRYDLGWYAGRVYGLLAASFVLLALLLENSVLHAQVVSGRDRERRQAREALGRHAERLRILHAIDRAIVAGESPEAIAGAAIRPLRDLLGVPRAIVNVFDLEAGEVEWLAAAGRRRDRVGPGVRYSMRMMGDVKALARGEPQVIDTRRLPPGPEVDALLASGVHVYMAVPMIAGGELIGALSFGDERPSFPAEQVMIVQEVATQLAIAIVQARLLARIRRQAEELERRVAERTADLERLNRELEDLYDNAPCGYHSVDADGRIVRMNKTWLSWLGYSRDEVVGRMAHPELMTAESAAQFREKWFPLFLRQGWLKEVEFEYRRKDGSTFPGSLQTTAVYDADGRYVTSRTVVFDISARKQAEERIRALNADLARNAAQLEVANRELESFSYSVSHDLRAPLRAVDGYALMLEEDYGSKLDAEGRRLLGVVRDEATRMGQLIDDLLAFSRTGRQALQAAPVDMEGLARETVAEFAVGHPSARIDIGTLPAADGDRAMLRQVWANLIGNALKYSSKHPAPRIEIGGRAAGEAVEYWVRDNGAGFDPRYAHKLFGVFQRLHAADEFTGTGVGLAIVQRVVARHGGRVRAEGAPGAGATFTFSLPAKGGNP